MADIEDALRFVERNTRTAYRIEGLRREDVPEYPVRALREAITNAVMHRDYFEAGAKVFVELYSDRIEISNPGGLPPGMRPHDLGRKSVRRNPLIADLLHRASLIEKAGTGIRRMREQARAAGCPAPRFEVTGFFTAIFRPKAVVETSRPRGTRRGMVPGRDQVETKPGLSRDQAELLSLCRSERSLGQILREFGRTNRTKFRESVVRPLIEVGLLAMTMPDAPRSPKQRYVTTARGAEALRGRRPRR